MRGSVRRPKLFDIRQLSQGRFESRMRNTANDIASWAKHSMSNHPYPIIFCQPPTEDRYHSISSLVSIPHFSYLGPLPSGGTSSLTIRSSYSNGQGTPVRRGLALVL
ncbi:hypothetical protein FRC15_011683 [Serendipita sp. 397]|nr:hypothetical protein FRC15_011683 [Serendipita sp. 397]